LSQGLGVCPCTILTSVLIVPHQTTVFTQDYPNLGTVQTGLAARMSINDIAQDVR